MLVFPPSVTMLARAGAPLDAVPVHCVSRPASGSRFMEAEAKLYDGDREVPGAVAVEGLNITGDQKTVAGSGSSRSRVFGNGDKAKAELAIGRLPNTPGIPVSGWQQKFAYSPVKYFIKPDVLTRLDQDMRLDFKERFRVKVELKLYRDSEQHSHGVAEAKRNFTGQHFWARGIFGINSGKR